MTPTQRRRKSSKTARDEQGKPTVYSSQWRALVQQCREYHEAVCYFCGGEIDMTLPGRHQWSCEVHHPNARAFGGDTIVPVDELRLAHKSCNAAHGAKIRGLPRGRRSAPQDPLFDADRSHFSRARPTHPVPVGLSLSKPKATETARSRALSIGYENTEADPASFVPPRLETRPDSSVVGTLGDECIDWLDRWLGMELWAWQAYVVRRALEVTETGELRWPVVVLTVPRQCGKSTLSRGVMSWRLFQADRFEEPQTLLHVSSNRAIAREIWQMSARMLEVKADAKVRQANGQESIELPDESKWMIAAANMTAGPGLSISMAFVDEAWHVDEDVVVSGIMPTMLQRTSSQLWLVSTAGESRSDLLRNFREQGIAQLDDPDHADVLLLEWSASPDLAVDDREAWRQASPIWNARREKQVEQFHRLQPANDFAMQMLNRWVTSATSWLPEQSWTKCGDDVDLPTNTPGVIGVETSVDGLPIGAVIAVMDDDGIVHVRSHVETTHAAMWRWLKDAAADRRGVTILHHATVRIPDIKGATMLEVKASDQVAGYGPTRAAILAGNLRHNRNETLTEQVLMASAYQSRDGHSQLSQKASEGPIYLARALVWAVGHELKPNSRRRHLVAVGK